MKLGIAIFPADYAIRPDELARAVEERGFESLFFTDHTHIPATPATRELMEQAHGGVQPHFTHNHDPFVAMTYAAAATTDAAARNRRAPGARTRADRDGQGARQPRRPLERTRARSASASAGSPRRSPTTASTHRRAGRSWTSGCRRSARSGPRTKRSSTAAMWTSDPSGPGPSRRSDRTHPSSSAAPAEASSAACSPMATNGCRTPACPSNSSRTRIRELQDAARAAGRDADIPVTVQGAEPDARALDELREIGVTRATLYAPSAGAEQVLRFLDDVAPLVDATKE